MLAPSERLLYYFYLYVCYGSCEEIFQKTNVYWSKLILP